MSVSEEIVLEKKINGSINTHASSLQQDDSEAQAWVIWVAAALFYVYEYVLRVSPSVMTDGLTLSFGVTSTALGVLTSFYYYSYSILQIPCGVIVDRFGPRRVITFSAALCSVGSLIFAFSESLYMAQIGRFIIGAGSACAFLSTLKVAADWFSAQRFALIVGLTCMMGVLGGTMGAKPMAVLVNAFGWRSAMYWAALVGIIVTAISWIFIKDKKVHKTDYYEETFSSLLTGLKAICSMPQVWLIALYGSLMYLPISAFAELWGVPYLMKTFGIDNEYASFSSIMLFVGMGIGGPVAAWLSNKIESRYRIMIFCALGSLVLFSIIVAFKLSLMVVFALLFVIGLMKGGQTLTFTCVKEITPIQISGTTIGFTNAVVMLSGVIFQPGLGILLDYVWDGTMSAEGLRIYSAQAYNTAMYAIPIALFINLIMTYFIKETYPKPNK